jgi:hypothetical protein
MNVALKEHFSKNTYKHAVTEEIENHQAWHGHMSGLVAEKLLRGTKTPYLYLLRSGEQEGDYYVTYVLPDLNVKHQPFIITSTSEGWHCQNGGAFGPLTTASFDDILHLIMHCGKLEPKPHNSLSCVNGK